MTARRNFSRPSPSIPKEYNCFNLAVSLRRKGDTAGAAREIDQALKLRPNDSELQAFAALLKGGPTKVSAVNRIRVHLSPILRRNQWSA